MVTALALVGCYMMGAVPFGLIIGKLTRGIDIRQYGSGNIGASNVLRTLGVGPALLVFFFDTAKGFVAAWGCIALGLDPHWVVAGALLSIFGHTFSLFLGFKGGKGVATSLGVIIGLDWRIAAIAFVGWVVLVAVTRYISIASILASLSVPLQMVFWKSREVPLAYQIMAGIAALAILLKHIPNLRRLANGTEARFGQKVSTNEE
ncbi:MAG: glycerol-3-phosphate 1-O-acyltransferase PlsY [Armatimonadetes bacterium]|nr:glycerol-3-phosphate 1-O-acyltransferase PlsY [Armatimonadota bacterium]